jgi:hypothetical protein
MTNKKIIERILRNRQSCVKDGSVQGYRYRGEEPTKIEQEGRLFIKSPPERLINNRIGVVGFRLGLTKPSSHK